jgi:hypothetical protein
VGSRKTSIRPVVPGDAEYVAARLHPSGVEEVKNSIYATAQQALAVALSWSVEARTGTVDGIPFVIYGVCAQSLLSPAGVPWMLCTTDIHKCPITFARQSRRLFEEWRARFEYLVNYVDASDEIAVKWVRWMGFDLHPAEPYGRSQKLCYKFTARGHLG